MGSFKLESPSKSLTPTLNPALPNSTVAPSATPTQLLKPCRDGDSTAASARAGQPFFVTTFSLISHLNLPWCNVRLFPLVLLTPPPPPSFQGGCARPHLLLTQSHRAESGSCSQTVPMPRGSSFPLFPHVHPREMPARGVLLAQLQPQPCSRLPPVPQPPLPCGLEAREELGHCWNPALGATRLPHNSAFTSQGLQGWGVKGEPRAPQEPCEAAPGCCLVPVGRGAPASREHPSTKERGNGCAEQSCSWGVEGSQDSMCRVLLAPGERLQHGSSPVLSTGTVQERAPSSVPHPGLQGTG